MDHWEKELEGMYDTPVKQYDEFVEAGEVPAVHYCLSLLPFFEIITHHAFAAWDDPDVDWHARPCAAGKGHRGPAEGHVSPPGDELHLQVRRQYRHGRQHVTRAVCAFWTMLRKRYVHFDHC